MRSSLQRPCASTWRDANPFTPTWRCYDAAGKGVEVPISRALDDLVELAAERNFDDYEADGSGGIRKI